MVSPIPIIVLLLVVGVGAGMVVSRRGRGGRPGRTLALTLVCSGVALACLLGAVLLVPCALQQGDVAAQLRGGAPFCPAFLAGGDR